MGMIGEPNILVIVTTHAALGETGEKTGFWLEELSTPYYIFADGGARVTVASLHGGAAPIDPRSVEPSGKNPPSVERFLKDRTAMAQVRNSKRLGDLRYDDYDVVFMPGGHGAMWDLASSNELGEFLTQAWAGGKIIASVCHGPAGLINAKDVEGKPLVAGKKVSSFSDSEETAAKLTRVVPFLLESRLRQLGGNYQSGPDFKPFAVRDGRLVTGQNPASSEMVAKLVFEAAGKTK